MRLPTIYQLLCRSVIASYIAFVIVQAICINNFPLRPNGPPNPFRTHTPYRDSSGTYIISTHYNFGATISIIMRARIRTTNEPTGSQQNSSRMAFADRTVAAFGLAAGEPPEHFYGVLGTIGWPVRWGRIKMVSIGSRHITLLPCDGIAVGGWLVPAIDSFFGLIVAYLLIFIILYCCSIFFRYLLLMHRQAVGVCVECGYPSCGSVCPECGQSCISSHWPRRG